MARAKKLTLPKQMNPLFQLNIGQSFDYELTVMRCNDKGLLYPTEMKITLTIVRIPGGWLSINGESQVFIPYSNQGIYDHEF